MITLKIKDIDTSPALSVRSAINSRAVEDYAGAYEQGAIMPPVLVVFDNFTYWCYDGLHRIHALKLLGREEVDAMVKVGPRFEADWLALGANAQNGRRNEDRAHLVELALKTEQGNRMTNEELAAYLGMSRKTLQKYRKNLGFTREYERVQYENLGVYETEAIQVIESMDKKIGTEMKLGKFKKPAKELIQFAGLPEHERVALFPFYIEKNLSLEAAKDIAKYRPTSEELPLREFVDYAQEHEDGRVVYLRNNHIRLDFTFIADESIS